MRGFAIKKPCVILGEKMSKLKSAIITALFVAAVVVLALFATISCMVPGTNGVKKYNSFISSISLGSELTGNAYATLYPAGVISSADYELVAGDADNTQKDEYESKYVQRGGLYVDKDKLTTEDNEKEFKQSVANDAKILSERFGQKGYSSYSVAVVDDFAIRVTVPTGFTYAAYTGANTADRSDALSSVAHTIQYLMLDDKLTLRDGTDYDTSNSILINVLDDVSDYFKSVSAYAVAGNYAVKLQLTDDGFDKLNAALTAGDGTAYFFIGKTNLNLTMTMGEELTEKTMYYSATKTYTEDYAIVLDSVVNGNLLANAYNSDGANSDTNIVATDSVYGKSAAIFMMCVVLLAIVGAIAFSVVKYKMLGLVNALMVVIYALVIVCATMLIGIQVTVAGMFTAILGLALMCFTNFRVFEAVRAECATGKIINSCVKSSYKKSLITFIDLYVVLLVASLMLTLIGVGEVAACGFIFFIATIASYVLYWFTRLMWFITSGMAKDKFKFCGFDKGGFDDED